MDATLKVGLRLVIEDGLDVTLNMALPLQASNVEGLRESVKEQVGIQCDSLLDALQEQMRALMSAAGTIWAAAT